MIYNTLDMQNFRILTYGFNEDSTYHDHN